MSLEERESGIEDRLSWINRILYTHELARDSRVTLAPGNSENALSWRFLWEIQYALNARGEREGLHARSLAIVDGRRTKSQALW